MGLFQLLPPGFELLIVKSCRIDFIILLSVILCNVSFSWSHSTFDPVFESIISLENPGTPKFYILQLHNQPKCASQGTTSLSNLRGMHLEVKLTHILSGNFHNTYHASFNRQYCQGRHQSEHTHTQVGVRPA